MEKSLQKDDMLAPGWLLFFYSTPSKPVSSRVRIWRRLAKAGAVQLKGSVYILPFSEDHYELLQWLVSEVASLKGDGAFVRVEKVETLTNSEITDLFDRQRGKDYLDLEKGIDDYGRKLDSIKKGGGMPKEGKMPEMFNKYKKGFEEIRRIDFFSSKTGEELGKKLSKMESEVKGLSEEGKGKPAADIVQRQIEDYQGRVWCTRKRPFIDRMASAWLIRHFIDRNAEFAFVDDKGAEKTPAGTVVFDLGGGEFTHVGDMCTFEVIVKSFGLKDKALKKVAEIVHDLDIKDDKYSPAEAKGLEEILTGIRKTAKDDRDALEKGMSVFEMLYASKTQ